MRVVTYNVHFAEHPQEIVDALLQNPNLAEADVIFLQEIEHYTSENLARAERIASGLKFHFYYAPSRPLKNGSHGIATLSRFPFIQNKVIELPGKNKLVLSHPRVALISTIKVLDQNITLCNVHLDPRLTTTQRIHQLDAALSKLEGPSIVGGDFNTVPFLLLGGVLPIGYQNQKQKIHEHFISRGFMYHCQIPSYTLKRGLLKMQLDDIYTNMLPIINSGVEENITASDHKPVWAEIKV